MQIIIFFVLIEIVLVGIILVLLKSLFTKNGKAKRKTTNKNDKKKQNEILEDVIRKQNDSIDIEFNTKYNSIDEGKKKKGIEGEQIVKNYLKQIKANGKILNNLHIYKANEEPSEIDSLFLTKEAIFVIESKNIEGTIEGNNEENNWKYIRKVETGSFRNPIKQNEGHIKHLKNVLQYSIPIYSIIAFNDKANLSNIEIEDSNIEVIHYNELVDTINSKLENGGHFLNDGKFNILYYDLQKYTNVSDEVKEKHINYIKTHYG